MNWRLGAALALVLAGCTPLTPEQRAQQQLLYPQAQNQNYPPAPVYASPPPPQTTRCMWIGSIWTCR